MAYDMERRRLADALRACAEALSVGHMLEVKLSDLDFAFGRAPGESGADGFLTALPSAAWDYRHRIERDTLTIMRIERDGNRRYVAPAERLHFEKVGEVFWPRHGALRDA